MPPGRFWIRRPLDADADDAQQRLLFSVVKRRVDAARLGRPLPVRGPVEEAHDAPLGFAPAHGCVEIKQMQLRGRRRVDGVGCPKFDVHTG